MTEPAAGMDILAIVGSEHWPPGYRDRVIDEIRTRILVLGFPDLVISGGAHGVDTWAVEVAKELSIPTKTYIPTNPRWQPDGYKARNILIARTCSRLVAIRFAMATRYGSGWTADYAERIGKPVDRVII